mgnify:FL=1
MKERVEFWKGNTFRRKLKRVTSFVCAFSLVAGSWIDGFAVPISYAQASETERLDDEFDGSSIFDYGTFSGAYDRIISDDNEPAEENSDYIVDYSADSTTGSVTPGSSVVTEAEVSNDWMFDPDLFFDPESESETETETETESESESETDSDIWYIWDYMFNDEETEEATETGIADGVVFAQTEEQPVPVTEAETAEVPAETDPAEGIMVFLEEETDLPEETSEAIAAEDGQAEETVIETEAAAETEEAVVETEATAETEETVVETEAAAETEEPAVETEAAAETEETVIETEAAAETENEAQAAASETELTSEAPETETEAASENETEAVSENETETAQTEYETESKLESESESELATEVESESATEVESETETETEVTDEAESESETETEIDDEAESESESETEAETEDEEAEKIYIEITAEEATLYKEASTESDVLGVAAKGTRLELLSTISLDGVARWYQVVAPEAEDETAEETQEAQADLSTVWSENETADAEVAETETGEPEQEVLDSEAQTTKSIAYVQADQAKLAEEEEETEEIERVLTWEDEQVKITVAGTGTALPENIESLIVVPIVAEDSQTAEQYEEVKSQLEEQAMQEQTTVGGFLAYDIKLMDVEGNEIEPDASVRVTMEYKEAAIPEEVQEKINEAETTEFVEAEVDVTIMHLKEDENGQVVAVENLADDDNDGQIETLEVNAGNEVQQVEFTTESFSKFIVRWRVNPRLVAGDYIIYGKGKDGNYYALSTAQSPQANGRIRGAALGIQAGSTSVELNDNTLLKQNVAIWRNDGMQFGHWTNRANEKIGLVLDGNTIWSDTSENSVIADFNASGKKYTHDDVLIEMARRQNLIDHGLSVEYTSTAEQSGYNLCNWDAVRFLRFDSDKNEFVSVDGTGSSGAQGFDGLSEVMFMSITPETVTWKETSDAVGADTASHGIIINLFDYGPNDGDNSIDKSDSSLNSNGWNKYSNKGINENKDLKFQGYGSTPTNNNGNVYTINTAGNANIEYDDQGYPSRTRATQGIVQNTLTNGYPTLSTGNHQSLDYLFSPNSTNANVTKYLNLNKLFVGENGWYMFDSNQYYAQLNTGTKEFRLRQWVGNSINGTTAPTNYNVRTNLENETTAKAGFFPLNTADTSKTSIGYHLKHTYNVYNYVYDNPGVRTDRRGSWQPNKNQYGQNITYTGYYNHHFGMTLKADFVMTPNGTFNGRDIVFNFSGDDDMWVFVDGNLVLDIGGIHEPVSGSINFTKGTWYVDNAVRVGDSAASTGSPVSGKIISYQTNQDGYKTENGVSVFDTSNHYATHTIQAFYLERGGQYSNLALEINLPTVNHVRAEKQVLGNGADGEGVDLTEQAVVDHLRDKDYQFRVLLTDGTYYNGAILKKVQDYKIANQTASISSNDNGEYFYSDESVTNARAYKSTQIHSYQNCSCELQNNPNVFYYEIYPDKDGYFTLKHSDHDVENVTYVDENDGQKKTKTVATETEAAYLMTFNMSSVMKVEEKGITEGDYEIDGIPITEIFDLEMVAYDVNDNIVKDPIHVNNLSQDGSEMKYADTWYGDDIHSVRFINRVRTVDVEVVKEWEPDIPAVDSITVKLYADGVDTGKTITLNDGNQWADAFRKLPKFSIVNGKLHEINYTIEEVSVPGYDYVTVYDETISLSVKPANYQYLIALMNYSISTDSYRIEDYLDKLVATAQLNRDGAFIDSEVLSLVWQKNGDDFVRDGQGRKIPDGTPWIASFDDLPRYRKTLHASDTDDGGNAVPCTHVLTDSADYTQQPYDYDIYKQTASDDVSRALGNLLIDKKYGYKITNTLPPTEVKVKKIWTDEPDIPYGFDKINVELIKDGVPTGQFVELNKDNGWEGSWTGLDRYKASGQTSPKLAEIDYTVKEYVDKGNGNEDLDPYIATYEAKVDLKVVSTTPKDENSSVVVKLYANGAEVTKDNAPVTVTLDKNNNWTATFEELDKYDANDQLINYSVKKDASAPTEAKLTVTKIYGNKIYNTLPVVDIDVEKQWEGNPPADAKITVYLYKNGVKQADKSLTLEGSKNWKGTFTNLPKYEVKVDDNGTRTIEEIVYTVVEDAYPGYYPSYTYTKGTTAVKITKDVDGVTVDTEKYTDSFVITNKPVKKPALRVKKTFEGLTEEEIKNNLSGYTVTVTKNGETTGTDLNLDPSKLEQVTGSDKKFYTEWFLDDYDDDTYNVKESSYLMQGITTAVKLNGTAVTAKPDENTGVLDMGDVTTGASNMSWSNGSDVTMAAGQDGTYSATTTVSGAQIVVGKVKAPDATDDTNAQYFVWTKEKLGVNDRAAVLGLLGSDAGYTGATSDNTFFFTNADTSISWNWNTITNNSGTLDFSGKDQWEIKKYDFEQQDDSIEIRVENNYNDVAETELILTKADSTDETVLLAGAEFQIYKDEALTDVLSFYSDATKTTQVDVLTTDTNGQFHAYGIPYKTDGSTVYYMKETKAPTGYIILQDVIKLEIAADGKITFTYGYMSKGNDPKWTAYDQSVTFDVASRMKTNLDQDDTTNDVLIKDPPLYSLPSTGGMGIYWYMISGVLLMLAAAMIYIKNRRKEVLSL